MRRLIPFLLLATLTLGGCLAPRSFLEPKYRGISYSDIRVPAQPYAVTISVTGETNGDENSRATPYWTRQVRRVLGASRVFTFPEGDTAPDRLSFVFNNFGSRASAAGKGFVTGLTFGAVGSLVTDGYSLTVVYSRPGKPPIEKTYQHAIYTTIGNAAPPPGITPVSISEAPSLVAEDMLLHFVKDLQDDGSFR